MKKEIKLTKEQQLEKQKYMHNLENNIKDLEYQINNVNKTNLKINALKNIKKSLKFCQLIAPYLVAYSLSFSIFSLFNATPFYTDDRKQYLENKKTIDSFGTKKYEEQYYEYEDNTNIITYYEKWQKNSKNGYSRNIRVYKLGNLSERRVLELIEKNNIKKIEDIFGTPLINRTETREFINNDELLQESYLEAQLYNKDKNNFIIVKEGLGENIEETTIWFLIQCFVYLIISTWRDTFSNFDFKKSLEKIEEENQKVDVESLKKILELKKDNYNRLTR